MDSLISADSLLSVGRVLLPVLVVPCGLLWLTWALWQIYITSRRDPSSPLPLPPGDVGLPILGHTLQFIFNHREFIDKRVARYGPVFKLHVFGEPSVGIAGIHDVKAILHEEYNTVTNEWPTTTRELLGAGALSMMLGQVHKSRKKITISAFRHGNLSVYHEKVQDIIKHHIQDWTRKGQILAHHAAKALAFAVTCAVLVGFKHTQTEEAELLKTFTTFIGGLFTVRVNLPGFPFYKGRQARDILKRKVAHCIRNLDSSDMTAVPTVLSALMTSFPESEATAENEALLESVVELMFASHDTTTGALFCLMLHLSQNPDVVQKLRREIEEYRVQDDGSFTFDTALQMPYLNAVITDSLAVKPPVPSGLRRVNKTFEHKGYQIPKSWKIVYLIKPSHDLGMSQTFNPDRWIHAEEHVKIDPMDASDTTPVVPDQKTLPSPKDLLHFGYGARSCVGKEFAKLMLRTFVVHYVLACDAELVRSGPVPLTHFPIINPTDGMPLKVVARDGKQA